MIHFWKYPVYRKWGKIEKKDHRRGRRGKRNRIETESGNRKAGKQAPTSEEGSAVLRGLEAADLVLSSHQYKGCDGKKPLGTAGYTCSQLL